MRKENSRPMLIPSRPVPRVEDASDRDDLHGGDSDLFDEERHDHSRVGGGGGAFQLDHGTFAMSPDMVPARPAAPVVVPIQPHVAHPAVASPLNASAAAPRKKLTLNAPAFVPRSAVPIFASEPGVASVVGLGVTKAVLAESFVKDEQVLVDKEDNGFSINYDEPKIRKKVTASDFEVLKMVGEGAYGRVFQVRHTLSKRIYAMKTLKKKFLINSNNVEYTFTERNVLRRVQHPFVVGLHFAFQTKGKVYLVMDFLNGGQIFYHLKRQTMFQEDEVRFYAAEITLALSHLHSLGIVHRDLKPENILLDSQGHVHLTDFGLARDFGACSDGVTGTYCGTVEYMAPEMVQGLEYTLAVDWWSVGILLYDMLTGSPPWTHKNEKKLCDLIVNAKLVIPNFLSPDAISVLAGLLQRDVAKRFDAKHLQEHAWFQELDFGEVLKKSVTPPWLPTNIHGDMDTLNFESKYIQRKVAAVSPTDNCDELSKSQNERFAGFSYVRSPTDRLGDM